ncbi:MAG: hypothetical protein R3D66_06460 [Alphaproteobacteria bacterium]
MRVELKKLMEYLGVDHVLSPYETQPWFHYDAAKGITCSAEVRMGSGGDDIEVEMQFLKDETSEEESGESDGGTGGGPEQIMFMRAEPSSQTEWSPKQLRVQGKNYVNELPEWEKKGCDFFRASIESMQMGELPDIDALIAQHLVDDSLYGGGGRGRVGRKSPKVKPGQLLGMGKKP